MNKSKYINSNKCLKCGKCCMSFTICYPKSLSESNKIMFSEVQRFKDLLSHNKIKITEDNKTCYVTFNYPCKYLIFNNGSYACKIYSKNRPELCKEYPYKETMDCPHKNETKGGLLP